MNICILEKGSEIGSHIVSGNCFDSRALDELIPDWKEREGNPVTQKVHSESIYYMTSKSQWKMPLFLNPAEYKNDNNYIISLGQLCKWLAIEAEELGVDVLVGFAGSELLFDEDQGHVTGVATNDFGIAKDGSMKDTYQRGMAIKANFTILSEGARGSLSEEAIAKFDLRKNKSPQTYGLGFKEVWEIDMDALKEYGLGKVVHTIGYPVDQNTYGGGFLYTMEDGKVHLGYILGLDYKNPHLNLYQEFQLWKSHPKIRPLLEKGRCIKYGARVISQGGFDAIPELTFPGGALIGCSAGFVDILKIKGTHNAMKTGMMAAEAIANEVNTKEGVENVLPGTILADYENLYENSWVYSELKKVRHVKQGFKNGLFSGLSSSLLAMHGFLKEPIKPLSTVEDHETMNSINR